MKNGALIQLPAVYDAGGDLDKKWFVYFSAKNPRTGKVERQRMFRGINQYKTLKERRKAAEKMCKHWTDKIRSGWSPFIDEKVIYDDNLEYQTYIKNYRKAKASNGTFRFYSSKYLDAIKNLMLISHVQLIENKRHIEMKESAANPIPAASSNYILSIILF